MNHSDRIRKLVVIGTNFHTDGYSDHFKQDLKRLTVASVEKDPVFSRMYDFYKKHAPDPSHFSMLLKKLKHMWLTTNYKLKANIDRIWQQTLPGVWRINL